MSSLYVDHKNVELKADGEALVFSENGMRIGTVPLQPLSRVFLRGDIKLNSGLLGKLGEHGIGVIVLSGRKSVPSLLLGRPHNDAARRIAQYPLPARGLQERIGLATLPAGIQWTALPAALHSFILTE
jgi:CRISPR-associated protein Cas1